MTFNRTIGGEMEISPTMFAKQSSDIEWPDFRKKLMVTCDTGRSAFRLALRHWQAVNGGVGKVWLPDYICHSMPEVVGDEGLSHAHYCDRPGMLTVEPLPELGANDLVVIVHYFGMINRAALTWLKAFPRSGWMVLEDCVQAAYSNGAGYVGDYAIVSLRKWWPVPDGAALYLNSEDFSAGLAPANEEYISQRLAAHLLRATGQAESRYLGWIHNSEGRLQHSPPRMCSWISQRLLSSVDVEAAKQRRGDNWHYLNERLGRFGDGSTGVIPVFDKLAKSDIPMTYPIRVTGDRRNHLKDWLSKRRIYCPIHWQLNGSASAMSKQLSTEILSLPIDQRYGKQDMDQIICVLADFEKENKYES